MPPENKIQNKAVETYASDMAQVISGDKEGLLKKIIHEEEDRDLEKINLSPESSKNKAFLVASMVMLGLSVAVLLFFFLQKTVSTVDVPPQFVPMIFTDQTKFLEVFDLKKEAVVQTILNSTLENDIGNGTVGAIYLTENKNIVGAKRFIEILGMNLILPKDKKIADNFLMGTVNNEKKDFFILLKVESLEEVFVNMRDWELKMLSDLGPLFRVNLNSSTKDLFTKSFEDGYIQNKNARILYDEGGQIVLMYVYLSDQAVLITNTELAAREIALRLASGKIKK